MSVSVAHEAQAYGRAFPVVEPQSDGLIVCEAEEFEIKTSSWQALRWGSNYYAATFANVFLSRKAYLGAPAQCTRSEAVRQIEVPRPGRYLVLARYEYVHRFATRFRIRIEQRGQTRLDRVYGAADNLKIWALGQRLKKQHAWKWGAVENMVWEGHDVFVNLAAGPAQLTLIAENQPDPAARRNVDLVVLTTDHEQVEQRIEHEGYLPLDGMLTQSGDVYLRVRNVADDAPMKLIVPPCRQHSPYWVHRRHWTGRSVTVPPGRTSQWLEVGSILDSLNDGDWDIQAQPQSPGALHYELEFGVRTTTDHIRSIRVFKSRSKHLDIAHDADTRYTHRIRLADQVLYDLVEYLEQRPVRGRPPTRMPIVCYTFVPKPDDPKYSAARARFIHLMGLAGSLDETQARISRLRTTDRYGLTMVNLGDEINLTKPLSDDHCGLRAYLRKMGLSPFDVMPSAGSDWNSVVYAPDDETAGKHSGLYYWSKRYMHHFGIQVQKAKTEAALRRQPGALVGANYSPHDGYFYVGEAHKWINLFREGGMTMPWSEDYIFTVPVGSQQMNFMNLDMCRAALKDRPHGMIQFYVMAHWPGNRPTSWRRLFYGDLGHGMKIANLFEVRPVQNSYTENHISQSQMYQMIRRSLHELGLFEDMVQDGQVRSGVAALWFGEAADIWDNHRGPFAAAKRSLYVAVRHQQLPVDIITEQDAVDGTLGRYKVVYLTDWNVTASASRAIVAWVAEGGRLFATAQAGFFDEYNRPNVDLCRLLGIRPQRLIVPPAANVRFIKQDLPFSEPIETVHWRRSGRVTTMPVIGARSVVRVDDARVLAMFGDGSPAVTSKVSGKGQAIYCGFLPGLTYFKPAIPKRPVDRNSRADSMSHFIPTTFHRGASALIGLPAEGVARPVVCSQPLVASHVIESDHGVLVPLVNWSASPIRNLRVTMTIPVPTHDVSLASGGPVSTMRCRGRSVFVIDLDVADALILR